MDLLTILRILLRRWLVLLPALLLTGVTAGMLSTVESATYESYGSVLLVGGSDPAGQDAGSADPELQPAAPQLQEELSGIELPSGGSFSVTSDSELPLLTVTARGESPEQALATLTAVESQAAIELGRLQSAGELGDFPYLQVTPISSPSGAIPEGVEFTASSTLLISAGLNPGAAEAALGSSSGDLGVAARILRERIRDDEIRNERRQAGGTAELELEGIGEDIPMMSVVATDDDPEATIRTGQLAIEQIEEMLVASQEEGEIPEELRVRLDVLAYPLEAEVVESNTMRTVLAVIALGGLASVGLTLMVDAALANRRARRTRRQRDSATRQPDGAARVPDQAFTLSNPRSGPSPGDGDDAGSARTKPTFRGR